ncbi:MAG: flavodoxin family protein [Nitrospirota bacterium]|nr:flavodoxin family protein [Nitrospirota bacterium]
MKSKRYKILGIVGSNRIGGNSYSLLKEMLKDTAKIKTKIIQVAKLDIKPCELCFKQCAKKPFVCIIKDDFKIILNEMKSADGIIIACPFYFYIPSKFQAFLERMSCLDYSTLNKCPGVIPFADKPCAFITVSASGSSFNAFQILHHLQEFALMLHMRPIITNDWPYIGLSVKSGGIDKGDILKQTETIKKAEELLKSLIKGMVR